MTPSPVLTRVVLQNYKSIAECDVRLGPLTYVVGEQASGKASLLDALQFVSDALQGSLEHALMSRGGMTCLLHRNLATAKFMQFRLEFALNGGRRGHYEFSLRPTADGAATVSHEVCGLDDLERQHSFEVRDGVLLTSSEEALRVAGPACLALAGCRKSRAFSGVLAALSAVCVYRLRPDLMRQRYPREDSGRLMSGGENLACVLQEMEQVAPDAFGDVQQYLHLIVRPIRGFACVTRDGLDSLVFNMDTARVGVVNRFDARCIADGALSVLGLLTALFQSGMKHAPSVIAIEKPETGLSPQACSIVQAALDIAIAQRQVIVTSHSPEMLDSEDLNPDSLLLTAFVAGATRFGTIPDALRKGLLEGVFSASDMLRQGHLTPDPTAVQMGAWFPDFWVYEKS